MNSSTCLSVCCLDTVYTVSLATHSYTQILPASKRIALHWATETSALSQCRSLTEKTYCWLYLPWLFIGYHPRIQIMSLLLSTSEVPPRPLLSCQAPDDYKQAVSHSDDTSGRANIAYAQRQHQPRPSPKLQYLQIEDITSCLSVCSPRADFIMEGMDDEGVITKCQDVIYCMVTNPANLPNHTRR